MHRELRREEKRREESGDKYKVGENDRPKTAREPQERVSKRTEHEDEEKEEIKEHEGEDESSDSDSGLFEMADMSQADKIVTVSITHETPLTTSTGSKKVQNGPLLARPGSATSQQGSHSPAAAALHPLNGLLQPTGRIPQAGYQVISIFLEIYIYEIFHPWHHCYISRLSHLSEFQANMRLLFTQRPNSASEANGQHSNGMVSLPYKATSHDDGN